MTIHYVDVVVSDFGARSSSQQPGCSGHGYQPISISIDGPFLLGFMFEIALCLLTLLCLVAVSSLYLDDSKDISPKSRYNNKSFGPEVLYVGNTVLNFHS